MDAREGILPHDGSFRLLVVCEVRRQVMSKNCPPVTVNTDEIVEAAKNKVLSELGTVRADAHAAQVRGLGKLRLVPSASEFNGTEFVIGYAALPPVVSVASKLADEGVILPKIDKALFQGVATGVNLIAQLFTGKSLLLGSLMGQIPLAMDSLAGMLVGAIKSKVASPEPAPTSAPGVSRIGQTPADEIEKLRRDLEKAGVSGVDDEDDEEDLDLAGVGGHRGVMFVR